MKLVVKSILQSFMLNAVMFIHFSILHSIPGTIVRKLFHPQNGLKIRQYALKLLVLWVQALQENAGDACMELFASAIPHFPPKKTPLGLPTDSLNLSTSSAGGLCERYGVYSSSSVAGDIGELIPKSNSIGAVMKGWLHSMGRPHWSRVVGTNHLFGLVYLGYKGGKFVC